MGHLNSTPVLDAAEDKTMILNMGPQHPSTHGVLRLLLEIDGEQVVRLMPDIGFLHTGIEKTCEAKFYQQIVPLTDRIDYLCPMVNNLCYVMAVEKLLGMEIPPRAQWMRVMLAELQRISSHLVWLGTHALDLGAMSVFLYCFREREDLLRIYEMVSGQRMMTSYFRIGGLALDPPLGFFEKVKKFLDRFPGKIDEYENLLTGNRIFIDRFKNVTEGFAVPPGEVYQAIESPRGEMGYYIVSDGTAKPLRVHMRSPSYANLQALPQMCEGQLIADVVAAIGSIDIVLGEIDR